LLIALAALVVFGAPATFSQQKSEASTHGTVNILLANGNGMVLVTDSRASDPSGRKVNDASQKLFQIDSTTVCSIAGFGSDRGPFWQLRVSAGGEILAIADGIGQRTSRISFRNKVLIVASGLASSLEALEMEYHLTENLRPPSRDQIVVLFAGFDLDGSLMIARTDISVTAVPRAHSEVKFQGIITNLEIRPVGKDFVYLTSGVDDFAERRLKYPQAFVDEKEMKDYMQAEHDGRTADLNLGQMEKLASYLELITASTVGVVGGPSQEADLVDNQVQMESPGGLIRDRKPYTRALIDGGSIVNFGLTLAVVTPPHSVFLDENCDHSAIVLDDSIMIGGNYVECNFYFDGGDIYRDKSAVIHGGALIFGPHVSWDSDVLYEARRSVPELTPISYNDFPDGELIRKRVWPND
jgi:hypothetical protein